MKGRAESNPAFGADASLRYKRVLQSKWMARCDSPRNETAAILIIISVPFLSSGVIGVVCRPYVLLDRDGTILAEKNYLASVNQVELLPGSLDGLRMLKDAGFGLIVVTNQSGIARGKLTVGTLEAIHAEMDRKLAAGGVRLDGLYYCPHGPDEGCQCRKPMPELARRAAADFGFDLREAFVIGDKPADVELGRNCGARTILVRTGYGREHEDTVKADLVADDLVDAARYILRQQTATR